MDTCRYFFVFFCLSVQVLATDYLCVLAADAGRMELRREVETKVERLRDFWDACGRDQENSLFCFGIPERGAEKRRTRGLPLRLVEFSSRFRPDDRIWLFIIGYASNTSRGVSFATEGYRFKDSDLTYWIEEFPAEKVIFALNMQSGPLIESLAGEGRVIITATCDTGEMNPPRFADHLIELWREYPSWSVMQAIRAASEAVNEEFAKAGLAKSEVARAFDGYQVYFAPFEKESERLAALFPAKPEENIDVLKEE